MKKIVLIVTTLALTMASMGQMTLKEKFDSSVKQKKSQIDTTYTEVNIPGGFALARVMSCRTILAMDSFKNVGILGSEYEEFSTVNKKEILFELPQQLYGLSTWGIEQLLAGKPITVGQFKKPGLSLLYLKTFTHAFVYENGEIIQKDIPSSSVETVISMMMIIILLCLLTPLSLMLIETSIWKKAAMVICFGVGTFIMLRETPLLSDITSWINVPNLIFIAGSIGLCLFLKMKERQRIAAKK